MLLLSYGDVKESEFTPSEFQKLVDEMSAWHDRVEARQRLIRGGKLADDPGRRLRFDRDKLVIDGPYTESKEVLGGFFLIDAADYDEAIRIASECPMLRYGGVVDVRMLDRITVGAE